MTEQDLRIGFIGLGAMGRPMVENLLKAAFPVTVFDARPEAAEPLEALGARIAHSPAEVARTANVVEIIVRTEEQVDAVLFGAPDGGVAANLGAGSTVLIHSTISPARPRSVPGLSDLTWWSSVMPREWGGHGTWRSWSSLRCHDLQRCRARRFIFPRARRSDVHALPDRTSGPLEAGRPRGTVAGLGSSAGPA